MSTAVPYSWVKQYPKSVLKNDGPPFGFPPPIDFEQLSDDLSKTFQLADMNITSNAAELMTPDQITEIFNKDVRKIFIKVAPLKSHIIFLIAPEDFERLLNSFLKEDSHFLYVNDDFKKAFTQFLFVETLVSFQKTFSDKGLTFSLAEEGDLPSENSYAIDLTVSYEGGSFPVRMIVPEEFRQSWNEKYSQKDMKTPSSLFKNMLMDIHVEIGKVDIPLADWKNIKVGDFILLDSCQWNFNDDKGRALLTINRTPFFRAKIKDGTVKILEYPLFNELEATMAKYPSDDEDFEETESDVTEEYVDEEEDIEEDEVDEDEVDEEENGEEEESEQEAEDTSLLSELKDKSAPQKPLKLDDVPLNIQVEVGRFSMTVQKLSELQPGQLIDMNIHPEEGVDLVLNGTCIAKGELLKIGDTLGVRILDIAQ